MTTGRQTPEEIFHQALAITDGRQRAQFLDQACGDDASLRAEVENLLKWHSQADSFLEGPPVGPEVTVAGVSLSEGPGTVIGHYKLLEKIGEGGMAVVYMAEQKEPIKRRVALKIIKPGMDSREVIARFEAERQALAMMDHPHVAKVFDAGTTETGRPFFVMELVRGVSITEYCDRNKLRTRKRLDLFLQVCQGVQHAHQKGIIHRDLKPSNILVTLHEGRHIAVIIDFGIAKATSQQLTEKTLFTRYAQMIGTPEYMSPEQAEMSRLDIDTRTDIYSLGVLLYELLTGTTPIEGSTLRQAGYAEIQRIIRDTQPPKPSTRLSTLGNTLTETAQCRQTSPEDLRRSIKGDLDWIVMKSMDKDRSCRYETAHELAQDIERHLHDEPIKAGPPSTLDRCRKFVRRNRALVTGGVAVAAALVVGLIVSTALYVRAEQLRGMAQQAAEKEAAARTEAQAVADFLTKDLLGQVTAEHGQSPQVRDILDRASQRLENRFADQPLVEAAIRETQGETYRKLGDYPAAEPHLKRAYDIRLRKLGERDPQTLIALNRFGELYGMQARYQEAEPLLSLALRLRREVLGPEHPDTLESMVSLGLVKGWSSSATDNQEGARLRIEAFETSRRMLSEDHPVYLKALGSVAELYPIMGTDMLPLYQRGLKHAQEILGPEHEQTLLFKRIVGSNQAWSFELQEAEPLLREALATSQRVFGPYHPETLNCMAAQGEFYLVNLQFAEARELFGETLRRQTPGRSLLHTNTLQLSLYLAYASAMEGDIASAAQTLDTLIDQAGRVQGPKDNLVRFCILFRTALFAMQGQAQEMRDWCERAIERFKDDDLVAEIHATVGAWQAIYPDPRMRDIASALKHSIQACELNLWSNADYICNLATVYADMGDFKKAIEWQERALEMVEKERSVGFVAFYRWGLTLLKSGRPYRDSLMTMVSFQRCCPAGQVSLVPHLERRYEYCRRVFGETHGETQGCIYWLVQLYDTLNKPEEAMRWRAKLIEPMSPGPSTIKTD